jgi:hypothetical protein
VRWRPPNREERQIALLWAVSAASALVLRPFWLAVAPLMPPCPFRVVTGVPCLTCGTTRAAVALLHGRPFEALAANLLAALGGAAFTSAVSSRRCGRWRGAGADLGARCRGGKGRDRRAARQLGVRGS